ncbi:hypothetical protein [Cupriavidus pauculus]|uniref:type IV toxin-antitoxin system AbiEi family antitoxin domain-containing protein n=1 Tax=Cupriavidus pauculus TaxID=82633 RepID=UPI001EE20CC2|nr:hypothetical protein [Cupriavidus pauculus]GJG96766.1 hypothetical protein CBA19C6_19775 [Cupriavidus pauculus]
MNRSRLQIAKADITEFFDNLSCPVLKMAHIRAILSKQRRYWRLAQRTSASDLIEFLRQQGKLNQVEFPFPQRAETLYLWGEVDLYTSLLGLRQGSYFSHYTAMRLQGLTEQTPTTIYLTDERSAGVPRAPVKLTQLDIDHAFAQPPRTSRNAVVYEERKLCLLNGGYTGYLGVVTQRVNGDTGLDVEVRLTNVERTLIDITVRPFYAGGIYEVVKAFELAKQVVSVNKLVATLRKLDFAYPYHQAIGYYLERAGYRPSQLDLVRRLPLEHDFYLAHAMGGTTRYVSDWRLFVPDSF